MEVSILNQSLKVVEQIYNECEYDSGDIYRIKDLIHSLDENHWRGKKWCADILRNVYKYEGGRFVVIGGWYGLLAYLLRKRFDNNFHIVSSDMDPDCQRIGERLFENCDIDFRTFNANTLKSDDIDCIICTSIEHMDPKIIHNIIKEKSEYTWIAVQSCNLIHPTHVNAHDTYQDLEKDLGLTDIIFSNSMSMSGFKRHMVIGR